MIKLITLLRVVDTSAKHVLSEDNENEVLSKFVTREMLELIVYSIHITKINQLDLKYLC